MKELDINVKELLFTDFLSARYSITSKINAEKLFKYCKENDLSFFTLSLAAILNSVNQVSALKKRIVNGNAVEFDYLNAVCPLLDEEKGIFKEMLVTAPQKHENIKLWHNNIQKLSHDILEGKKEAFEVEMSKRDELNICNCSCIPWVDFESFTNAVLQGNQIQPLITWGKVNENYEMAVSITVSHIFVYGRDLGYFFENLQENFDNIAK